MTLSQNLSTVSCSVLLLLFSSASVVTAAPDKKVDYETAANAFSIAELGDVGEPFFRGFFRRGWPTNRQTKNVTIYDATGSSEAALYSVLLSESGIPLSESAYIDAVRNAGLRKGGQPWAKGENVVDTKLSEFASIANYKGDIKFKPVFFEFGRATPKYKVDYSADSCRNQVWTSGGSATNQVAMEAIATMFYAQAKFASHQLFKESHESVDGNRTITNFGSSPKAAFFALVCIQNCLAKLSELKERCIYFKEKNGDFKTWAAYDLKGQDAWFPHRLNVKKTSNGLVYTVDSKDKNGKESDLFEQAMILRGCNELFKIVRFAKNGASSKSKEARRIAKLFTRQTFPGMEDYPFLPDCLDLVSDVALLVVTNIQRMHFDVGRRTMRSRSSDNPELLRVQLLTAKDIGATLQALSGFLEQVNDLISAFSRSQTSLKDRLIRKRRYATTCLRLLTIWLITKIKTRGGVFDRYNIAINRELDKKTSAMSIGMVIRGLLAAADLSSTDVKQDTRETAIKMAQDLMVTAERASWSQRYDLYVGRTAKVAAGKTLDVDVAGQICMLGALKEMAERQNDVRFLIRYTKLMESLKKHGFVRSETILGGEKGGDSDKDGINDPRAAGFAPIFRNKIVIK